MRWLPLCCLFLVGTCTRDDTPVERPPVPNLTSPQSHVPPLPRAVPPARTRKVPRLDPKTITTHLPPPVPVPFVAATSQLGAASEAPVQEKPTEEKVPEVDPVALEIEGWLDDANELEPGCLVNRTKPDLGLPSPRALATILRDQPGAFSGVAREALVCLLDLPRVSRAEVYGKNAFRGQALATRLSMAGGARKQGVIVAVITTDQPRGEGTYVGVLDERNEEWSVRQGLYLPWEWTARGRQLKNLRAARTLSRRRHTLVIRQRDSVRAIEQHVGLTSTEEMILLFQAVTSQKDENGVSRTSRVHVRGRKWPRDLVLRSLITPGPQGTDKGWDLQLWQAGGDSPYRLMQRLSGAVSLESGLLALEAGFPVDADWMVGRLPKAIRRQAAAHQLRALCAIQRKRFRHAARHWRKAVAASDSTPEFQRDYGLFLVERKRKKAAIKALRAYLKARPEAPDRVEIEAQLTRFGAAP